LSKKTAITISLSSCFRNPSFSNNSIVFIMMWGCTTTVADGCSEHY
jgi:hypothetical protein